MGCDAEHKKIPPRMLYKRSPGGKTTNRQLFSKDQTEYIYVLWINDDA